MAQFALADELGDYLGRTLEPDEVAQADLLLQLASAAIQSEAHQSLEFVADDTVSLRGDWGGSLWLPERPVIDVTAVTVRQGYGFPLSMVLSETLNYAWDRRGLLYRGPYFGGVESNAGPFFTTGGWGGTTAMVDVTYSHGYEEIPDDLRGLCLQLASRGIENPQGVEAEAVTGAYSVTYGAGASGGAVALNEDEKRIARRYRPVNA